MSDKTSAQARYAALKEQLRLAESGAGIDRVPADGGEGPITGAAQPGRLRLAAFFARLDAQ